MSKFLAPIAVSATIAFAIGCYVGWKTTMKVMDDILLRKKEF